MKVLSFLELQTSFSLLLISSLSLVLALPSSLVNEIKANEFRDVKVKRAHPLESEHASDPVPFYSKPSAIKRGLNLKNPSSDNSDLNDWSRDASGRLFDSSNYPNIPASLYNSNSDNPYEDKTVAEYEKGFQYGINKEKLDEALENAVLKSEMYGEPSAINQYRYYGSEGVSERRRKRRDAKLVRLNQRIKRDVELSPQEILTLLSIYDTNRGAATNDNYRNWYRSEQEDPQDEENWLPTPIYYPHKQDYSSTNYLYDDDVPAPRIFSEDRPKRFMVARKRSDPSNFYTLSELLSNQREPVYRRLVL